MTTQQTKDLGTMLDQCWSIVYDAGPTLIQHWVNVSCLLENCSQQGAKNLNLSTSTLFVLLPLLPFRFPHQVNTDSLSARFGYDSKAMIIMETCVSFNVALYYTAKTCHISIPLCLKIVASVLKDRMCHFTRWHIRSYNTNVMKYRS